MKTINITGSILLLSFAGNALAICSGAGQITNAASNVTETVLVNFQSIPASSSVSVAGLTLSNGPGCATIAGLTAANALRGRSVGYSGTPLGLPAGCGSWSGSFNGWSTTTAGTSATVTFQSATANTNVADLTVAGRATRGTYTQGSGTSGLTNLLTGNIVCVGSVGNWQAQEFHQSGGNLIDYKKGPSDSIDPTETVGSWNISGTGTGTKVNYTYGGTTYNNSVFNNNNGTYSFCATTETVATIKTGTGAAAPCP